MVKSRWLGCGLYLLAALGVLLVLGLLLRPMSLAARRASGGNDAWELWRACIAYAADHEGRLPPLDREPGRLMVDRDLMHDKYGVTGRYVTMEYDETAPFSWNAYDKDKGLRKNKDLIDDHSWWYLGYQVASEDEALIFVKAYIRQVAAGKDIGPEFAPTEGDKQLPALQFPPDLLAEIADAGHVEDTSLAKIPVFIERPGHYKGYSGGWVHYLDGHREYIDYPGRFPMTPRVVGMLQLLDDLGDIFKQPSE